MLGHQKFVFSLCLCNKVPLILMESYYYLLSTSFGYVFCLHMLCIKVYRKTSVGETHRDNKMEFDHENHDIQKAINQKPRWPKLNQNRPESGPPSLLHGLAGPPQHCIASCFVHGLVWAEYTLFSYVMLSVSNQIENYLINNFKNYGKIISIMT